MTPSTIASASSRAVLSRVSLVVVDEAVRDEVADALAAAGIALGAEVDAPEELPIDGPVRHGRQPIVVAGGGSRVARNAIVRGLRQRLPDARILLVAPADSRNGVRGALEAGADGVVFEGHLAERLGPTLEAIAAGQLGVPREAWAQVDRPTLSRREKQVLGLVVMDLTNGEIASRLFLAESTVKSHLSSAFVKLGVRSRNEAVRKILDPEERLGLGILNLRAADGAPAAAEAAR